MKLQAPVAYSSRIQPIPLPNGQNVMIGQSGIITGWGVKKEDDISINDILHQARIDVLNASVCESDETLQICAGVISPIIDTCQGDSGGSFIVKGGSGYYLAGFTSSGEGCKGKGIYTRVSAYEDWIRETIKNED